MLSIMNLAKLYGPIFRTDINGTHFIRISTQELVHEVCDDERFEKKSVPQPFPNKLI
jgi:cytochrome P450 / NADPH-cytochrome P450 reductase